MKSACGPRDENDAITSGVVGVGTPCAHVAFTFVCPLTKASSAVGGPLRWIAGSQWLSVSTSWLIGL